MPLGFASRRLIAPLVVLVSVCLVHWPNGAARSQAEAVAKPRKQASPAARTPQPAAGPQSLPQPVAEIRAAILAAVDSGDIQELRTALDWNELKPEVADTAVADPIAYWRGLSSDGEGREVLRILGEILRQPFAVLPIGRDIENNRLYVWPRFAEVVGAHLTPAEAAAMRQLIPPAVLDEMARTGRYLFWRLAIGADGTWHSFLNAR